jgi:prepilin-type N-terminal cleavage/methylation domain-containing protein
MRRNLNHRLDRGFTQIELLVVVIVVGILASVSIPTFVNLLKSYRVQDAMFQVEGVFKEAQRKALEKSIICEIQFDTTAKTITATPSDCLSEERTLDSDIILAANRLRFSFTHRGTTVNSGTIVVSSINDSFEKRCLAISNGSGIMRTGVYTSDPTSSVQATYCNSNLK